MQVIRFHSYGSTDVLQYEAVERPQAGPGEILIRVESASVNYSDIARRSNATYPFPTPLPFIPGSEVAGEVAALGEGVDGPPLGTPVFALVGTGANGYAQYAVTPAAYVIPIPAGVDYDQAASLPVAGTTAMLLLRDVAGLQRGESILIQGASGGVGSYAIQIAALMGADKIIGATSSTEKMQTAQQWGAHASVDYTREDWPEAVRELTGGHGVDIILEMQGGDSFAQGLRCLAPFGRSIVYGIASNQPLRFDDDAIMHFFYNPSLNQSIHVFNLGLWFGMKPEIAGQAMADVIGYVASGQLKVPVKHVLPLSQAAEAHHLMETRQTTGKVVLKPWL